MANTVGASATVGSYLRATAMCVGLVTTTSASPTDNSMRRRVIWRAMVPDIMSALSLQSAVYFLLTLSLFPLVTINGWFGASLTFPTEKT